MPKQKVKRTGKIITAILTLPFLVLVGCMNRQAKHPYIAVIESEDLSHGDKSLQFDSFEAYTDSEAYCKGYTKYRITVLAHTVIEKEVGRPINTPSPIGFTVQTEKGDPVNYIIPEETREKIDADTKKFMDRDR